MEDLEKGERSGHDKEEAPNDREIQSYLCHCRQQHSVPAATAIKFSID